MSNLKWADVAHYYLKSPIEVQKTFTAEFLTSPMGRKITDGIYPFDFNRWDWWSKGNSDTHVLSITPILRALEDMTEGEVVEYASGVGNGIPNRGKKPHSRLVKSSMGVAILTSTVHGDPQNERYCESRDCFFDRLTPAQFIWLISKGFDVFGLIEAGQAIRRGVES